MIQINKIGNFHAQILLVSCYVRSFNFDSSSSMEPSLGTTPSN